MSDPPQSDPEMQAPDAFPAALAFVWRPENDGQPYHCDPNDPGGATAWGVTHGTWASAANAGFVTGDLASAPKDALAAVLRVNYWARCQCGNMPPGVGFTLFNMAMLSGDGEAERILQTVVGVTVDGVVGPVTLRAVSAWSAADLITRLTDRDEDFFATLPGAKYFQHGWDRRAEDCRAAALAMLPAG